MWLEKRFRIKKKLPLFMSADAERTVENIFSSSFPEQDAFLDVNPVFHCVFNDKLSAYKAEMMIHINL